MSINLYEHPRKLYKYFPLSKDFAVKMFADNIVGLMFTPNLQRKEAEKIGKVIDKWRLNVIDGYIFYTSPQFFNDPFDTALPDAPEIVPTKEKRNEIIKELKRIVFIKKDEIDRLLYSEDFDRALRIVLEKISIDKHTKDEMWAHYAGSYKGFCIEYDFGQSYDISFQRGIGKVEYTSEKPTQEQFDDFDAYKSKVLLTKSECWSYEKEWRSIIVVEYFAWKNKMYPIIELKNYITAIYLGCNMPEDIQKEIVKAYKNTEVKVYKMKLYDNKFGFYFEQY
ncbi:MAG: DUF2971 domain-containing protein [Lachnospiraceae bacterium]|nr:DUF2971 domain-containing protein [Lachnospiraceae bacterium]